MYKSLLCACLTGCLLLSACGEDDKKQGRGGAAASVTQSADSAVRGQAAQDVQRQPQSAEELERADRILAFHNRAMTLLGQGLLADRLAANTHIYELTYRLGKRPQGARHGSLKPPSGLFTQADTQTMATAVSNMDKALAAMLGHYGNLEKYVADSSIQDDGRRGRELIKLLGGAYGQYLAARKSWLNVMRNAAINAEAAILAEHPLKRQIMAAQGILNEFQEVASLFASGNPDRASLQACEQNIVNMLAEGEKPPFPGVPAIEREYRGFIKQVYDYLAIFARGLNEGFHDIQRRELNTSALACQGAYNKFVAEANRT